ncbi:MULTISPECIES: hypothetical protein [Sphingobium]|jgi:hypothetical protein|uniref:Uncharacterized protein n=1 Tax=Sphingobium limneticum TaxID=1007511 RepID=A0A5J5I915_9SPHN|nr:MULTISPECIES: hypothetical protein [Sphingobium]KAA9020070.1 hypothetical protein F4U94_00295 [Sphingobium limneticum]KAA9021450.1 hypothetical protein F4U96_01800 [Sphingobium limneticum]KAA9033812.1 hypothetical protein F4U95_01800 [Sphingobium limneticum]BBD03284.1 hypothetical protein YGS_C2P1298 [Sphingobium sp. YG1]
MIHGDDRSLQAVRARAYALAETGQFDNSNAVQQALIAEGWSNAGRALGSDYARQAIGERCRAAAKAH